MELLTGTSGFSYKEWKGTFYPETLRAEEMLTYYAGRLGAVEINNTFYRMPSRELLAGWRERVPASFRFAIKAPQRITHRARLLDCQESVALLWGACQVLGEQLGPLLFQLPPNLRKDLERLRGFLAVLPAGARAAFEFRHRSWLADDVYDALRGAGAALCIADTDPAAPPEVVATADWGYLRLRDQGYTAADLEGWGRRIQEMGGRWRDTSVYFKHEEAGTGPAFARQLRELLKV